MFFFYFIIDFTLKVTIIYIGELKIDLMISS